ncbi:hypothetical protein [Enterovibrio sp. 27052020O]|uniref:hypothetical protein n=1 Tax=Enterovibrio sp. 27052020O TaxID=3241166 RepID=UPI00388CF4DB
MLFFMRSSFCVSAALLVSLFVSSAFSAGFADEPSASTAPSPNLYERQQVNISEPVCSANLRAQLLQQQIMFSNSQNSQEVRRIAEESIDVARAAFEEEKSYCAASLTLTQFVEKHTIENANMPKTGQIQSFDRSH